MEQAIMSSEELRKMQLIQLDMLKDFDRVCRKNNIKYIIDAGTLLGAVRHGGFIPWDDDIDIRMLRSEYEKFCLIAPKELDASIFFQSNKTDKYYPWLYAKLRRQGTKAVRVGQEHLKMHAGMFIDIFPCDGVPRNKVSRMIRNFINMLCRKILYARVRKKAADTIIKRFFWTCVSIIPMCIPHGVVKIISKIFDEKKCDKVGCIGWYDKKESDGFKKEWLVDTIEITFEGSKFFAPKDYDGFLKYSYGENYIMPPDIKWQKPCSPLSSYSFGDE